MHPLELVRVVIMNRYNEWYSLADLRKAREIAKQKDEPVTTATIYQALKQLAPASR